MQTHREHVRNCSPSRVRSCQVVSMVAAQQARHPARLSSRRGLQVEDRSGFARCGTLRSSSASAAAEIQPSPAVGGADTQLAQHGAKRNAGYSLPRRPSPVGTTGLPLLSTCHPDRTSPNQKRHTREDAPFTSDLHQITSLPQAPRPAWPP
jgi:hypothetical protein